MTQEDSSLAHSTKPALKHKCGEKHKVFTKHLDLDTHRHSKTGLRNLRGQLCMIQGFPLNGSPGKVLYCIVCWFAERSSGGCYSDCLHFLSVAAHIKGCVLVSIIVTNWILHFPRTHVTNLQQSEIVCVCVLKRKREVCFRCDECEVKYTGFFYT